MARGYTLPQCRNGSIHSQVCGCTIRPAAYLSIHSEYLGNGSSPHLAPDTLRRTARSTLTSWMRTTCAQPLQASPGR
ncbi:unnamed protein product, partial [Pleuronectes platessa]